MKTIDATPTWTGVLPLCIEALIHGDFEGRKAAMQELTRMAQIADLTVAAEQERGLTWSMDNYPPTWERPVLLALVKAILSRGFQVSIWLEGEPVIENTRDLPDLVYCRCSFG